MTVITGAFKIKNLPADFAITDVISLVKFLEANAALEFPASDLTNLVISVEAPDPTKGNVIWWRLNAAGVFVGIYTYAGSDWVQAFPTPNAITRVYGNSNNISSGYAIVSTDIPGITNAMVSKLQQGWERDPADNYWVIFDVVYVGV